MHQIVATAGDGATERRPASPAMILRTVGCGSVEAFWRHRRVRIDPDTYLLLPGNLAVTCEAATGTQPVRVEVSAAALAAVLGEAGSAGFSFSECLRDSAGAAVWLHERQVETAARAVLRDAMAQDLALRQRSEAIASVKPATRAELLRRILLASDFIQSRHEEPLSLDDMARAASLSRFHFVRLFNQVHGETPHAYLLRKRTAVARRFIDIGAAFGDAATRAGFGSRSALFRNLRKDSCCRSA